MVNHGLDRAKRWQPRTFASLPFTAVDEIRCRYSQPILPALRTDRYANAANCASSPLPTNRADVEDDHVVSIGIGDGNRFNTAVDAATPVFARAKYSVAIQLLQSSVTNTAHPTSSCAVEWPATVPLPSHTQPIVNGADPGQRVRNRTVLLPLEPHAKKPSWRWRAIGR